MSTEFQVTEDDEPFALQQEQVDKSVIAIRDALQAKSLTKVCLDCGEPIGEARLEAMPSATKCIDCASIEVPNARR